MNLYLRALDKDKKRIKQFPVTLLGNKAAIIYECEGYEPFILNLIKGIKGMSSEDIEIFIVTSPMFSEFESLKKLVVTESGELQVIEPKSDLIVSETPVQ
jgi:hypothetical protein